MAPPMKLPTLDLKGPLAWTFAPEWLGLMVIAAVDAAWARLINFHLHIATSDFHVLAAVLASMMMLRLFGQKRGGMMAEFLALTLAMAGVFTVFSYLSMASSGALADHQLLAIDKALGFDWLVGWKFLMAHPLALRASALLYNSLTWQALYLGLLLGLMARVYRMRELFWILFVSALFTNIIAISLPAYGPFEVFGLSSNGEFLPDMHLLRSGGRLSFALSNMTGVICFPSFHTVMALCYAYGLRKTGIVGHIITGMNVAMLFTIPFIGGHYLIDMIAGAAVMALSLALVKVTPTLSQNFAVGSAARIQCLLDAETR